MPDTPPFDLAASVAAAQQPVTDEQLAQLVEQRRCEPYPVVLVPSALGLYDVPVKHIREADCPMCEEPISLIVGPSAQALNDEARRRDYRHICCLGLSRHRCCNPDHPR